jgi:hypothetical protein
MVDFGVRSTEFLGFTTKSWFGAQLLLLTESTIHYTSCLKNVNYLSPKPSIYPTIDITAKERV